MSTFNNLKLGIVPDASIFHLESDQTLITVLTLLPLLSYPFLPSIRHARPLAELLLAWSSSVGLILILVVRHLQSLNPSSEHDDLSTLPVSLWLANLLLASAFASIETLRMPSRGLEQTPEDLHEKSFTSIPMLLGLELGGYFLWLFRNLSLMSTAETSGFLGDWIVRLIVIVGGFVVWCAVCLCLMVLLPILVFNLTTRRIGWWYWLPENGAVDEFRPWWSCVLAVCVALAPLVALVVAAVNVLDK